LSEAAEAVASRQDVLPTIVRRSTVITSEAIVDVPHVLTLLPHVTITPRLAAIALPVWAVVPLIPAVEAAEAAWAVDAQPAEDALSEVADERHEKYKEII
jgi:hypothetical protein